MDRDEGIRPDFTYEARPWGSWGAMRLQARGQLPERHAAAACACMPLTLSAECPQYHEHVQVLDPASSAQPLVRRAEAGQAARLLPEGRHHHRRQRLPGRQSGGSTGDAALSKRSPTFLQVQCLALGPGLQPTLPQRAMPYARASQTAVLLGRALLPRLPPFSSPGRPPTAPPQSCSCAARRQRSEACPSWPRCAPLRRWGCRPL